MVARGKHARDLHPQPLRILTEFVNPRNPGRTKNAPPAGRWMHCALKILQTMDPSPAISFHQMQVHPTARRHLPVWTERMQVRKPLGHSRIPQQNRRTTIQTRILQASIRNGRPESRIPRTRPRHEKISVDKHPFRMPTP